MQYRTNIRKPLLAIQCMSSKNFLEISFHCIWIILSKVLCLLVSKVLHNVQTRWPKLSILLVHFDAKKQKCLQSFVIDQAFQVLFPWKGLWISWPRRIWDHFANILTVLQPSLLHHSKKEFWDPYVLVKSSQKCMQFSASL